MKRDWDMKPGRASHEPQWSISDLANKFGVTINLINKHLKSDPKAPASTKLNGRLYFKLGEFTAWWETQVFVKPIKNVSTKVHRPLTKESDDEPRNP